MAKLTQATKEQPTSLTSHLTSPFTLCFRYKLYNNYTFSKMKGHQLKEWQHFLDQVSQMTFEDVEKRYRRISDTTDTFKDEQVIHYGISEAFRVHGIIEGGQFVVLRLDPKHSVH